jgi:2-C-methyl-D-erythritol 2,4-cyclodiphosphate synthase
MVRAIGRTVMLVRGDPDNIKITWPADLSRAEALLAARQRVEGEMTAHRVGLGWDVHPLVAGRTTVLAGVVLTGEFGPQGHSDGDPLAHAVCDALLGASALGDIGALFPDTDPQWKDAPGTLLLSRTAAALGRAGWRPVQVDAVVIADEPRIAPQRDAIRAGLARALGLPVEAVSVKGKRTEGLGGLAGGKGIACHALAVVEPIGEASR